MSEWKERLIKYIAALDESISTVEAEKLILAEMSQIKQATSVQVQEHLTVETVDNRNQLNKSMGMSELVALYRELFYGRQDVFAVRWDNEKAGTHGYAPKCKNEWDRNICGKSMRIKGACKKCAYKENQEITDQFIQQHFTGTGRNALVIGVYPLLEDETCRFLAIDFDKKNWQEEILIAKSIYEEYGIKSYIERSRSGNGGHLWIFFSEPIEARLARKLGTKVLETAINRNGSSKFDSFDRLFPNQDYMPKGGYGNLIALPLQKQAVENGNSVFVDDTFKMYSSQTAILQSIIRYSRSEILDVLKLFPDVVLQEVNDKELEEEDRTLPWEKKKEEKVPTDLPKSIDVVLYDKIYVHKNKLHPFLKKKFIRLTVFHNPEYYLARNLRKSVQDIPMWIQCFDEDSEFIMLPIGLEEMFVEICDSYHVKVNVIDKRYQGKTIDVNFYGDLREKQVTAVEELLAVSNGILHANTAFGKTVAAIALIAERKVNTLIIVDRISLLEQWRERIVLMQLGPVRYKDLSKVTSELGHKVLVQDTGICMED